VIWQQYRTLYNNALKQYSPKFKQELQKQVDTYCRTQDLNAISDKGLKKTIQRLHLALGNKMAIISNKDVKKALKSHLGALETKSVETDLYSYTILQVLEKDGLSQLAADITDTTKEQIRRFLIQAAEQNLTTNETIALLRTSGITDYRAELIARTETGRAANIGSQVGAIATGLVTMKEWISTKDNRTRREPRNHTDHLSMDGVQIPMDAKFEVPNNQTGLGFEYMDHPCDSKASAANVCNCRCTMGYEAVRGTNGKLLTYADKPPTGRTGMIWNIISNVIGMQIGNLIQQAIQD
jgi:hypothetical protein